MQMGPFRRLTWILCAFLLAASATLAANSSARSAAPLPDGSVVLPFENLEGIILVSASLHGEGGRDTTGLFALDSGTGFLVLDHELAFRLGLTDTLANRGSIDFANRPLSRFELGSLQIDQVSPVLMLDVEIVKRVTDRPVLGLLGERLFSSRAVVIDYRGKRVALIPVQRAAAGDTAATSGQTDRRGARSRALPASLVRASRKALGGTLSTRASAVPFRLAGDGKMLIRARVSNPWPPRYAELTMILDTGATKCAFFEEALSERVPRSDRWPALRGLSVPNLLGSAGARLARIPAVELATTTGPITLRGVDAAVMRSELSGVLSRAVGETVHGLLGYSFLRHFRVAIDYPHRILWLDPVASLRDERPYEYSHVGIQLERRGMAARVMAVAEGSPAAVAGIEAGDELTAIDGVPVERLDIISLARTLEGRPGSRVRLTLRRGAAEKTYSLTRRRLL